MYVVKPYDRTNAVDYAEKWADGRNPLFYDFTGEGGDCTNFTSQVLYAGGCVMNYTDVYGWYYISPLQRSAAWTGVQYFYQFLTTNQGEGPFGREVGAGEVALGDFVQLGGRNGVYYHSLVVTGFARNVFLVSAHTNDARNRRLDTYDYDRVRYLHVDGIRFSVPDTQNCFEGLYNGTALYAEEPTQNEPQGTVTAPDTTESQSPTPRPN